MVAEKLKKQQVYIPNPILNDLQEIPFVGERWHITELTFCAPTTYYRSDACEHGLGRYNIYAGRARRLRIPPDCVK
jgi:hypothetical protein